MSYSAAAISDALAGQSILGMEQDDYSLSDNLVVGGGKDLNVVTVVCTGCTAEIRTASLVARPSAVWASGSTTEMGPWINGYSVVPIPVRPRAYGNASIDQWGMLNVADSELLMLSGAHPIKIHAERISTTSQPSTSPSPFTRCMGLLVARKGLLSAEQFESLSKQLKSLLFDVDDDSQVSIISLDGLISFLSQHRPPTHPNIALTKHGLFTASWICGRKAKLTLTFDHEGGSWVAVNLDQRTRSSGAFVFSSLDGILPPYRSWIRP